jgi:hypothetical protein
MTFWWPVTDEEWERLNYPEKFQSNNVSQTMHQESHVS